MTILKRVSYLSNLALGFDFENYLTINEKQIVVFEIDTLNRRYLLKEGETFDDILEKSNNKYFDSKAGYLVDIKSKLQTQIEADLLLLSDIVLNSNPIDLDTIIIHELVHMLIESKNESNLELTEEAITIGGQIYKITDYHNVETTKHNLDFCKLLAQACINYNIKSKNFSTDFLASKSAMRFDIFED